MKNLLIGGLIIMLLAGSYFIVNNSKKGSQSGNSQSIIKEQKSSIDPSKILSGGPGKDGIPSIDKPKFTTIADPKNSFKNDDLVMVVTSGNEVKAYPILIMNWHEIVNDKIGSTPIVVTYCPLCGSGLTFKRILNGEEVQFGVSGKLYNSDLLMYDRKTDSLWSQITGEAVQGPLTGQKLEMLDTNLIDFKTLRQSYPNAQVLSKGTGFSRDYTRSPYGDYDQSPQTLFPVEHTSDKLFAKDRIIGVELNGKFKAYKFDTLKKKGEIADFIAGQQIILKVDNKGQVLVTDSSNQKLQFVNTFWFAWVAFHPETEVFK